MGLCVSGVSNGSSVGPVTPTTNVPPVAGGVALALAGDYAQIFVSSASAPGGPDVLGAFLFSGTYAGANPVVQYVADPANFTAGNWQSLNGVTRNDTGSTFTGQFALANNSSVQVGLVNVQGLYAVRVYLPTALTSGSLLVGGYTNPGTAAGVNSQLLVQMTQQNLLLRGVLLALSDIAGNNSNPADYLAAVGASL